MSYRYPSQEFRNYSAKCLLECLTLRRLGAKILAGRYYSMIRKTNRRCYQTRDVTSAYIDNLYFNYQSKS